MRESAEQVLTAYQALGLKARRTGTTGWAGPCPVCGGENRFAIFADGGVNCRVCGDFRAIIAALFNGRPPPDIDEDAIREAQEKRDRARVAAAWKARRMFQECRSRRHPYLERKGFDLRAPVWRGRVAVPVWGRDGIQSMQLIAADGGKHFLAGGRMAGGHAVIGPCDWRGRRWHVEGLATGLSVRRALGLLGVPDCVIICFSAAGLMVARDCHRALIVADHDESGAGQEWAERTGCPWWMPPEPGDANDYEQAHGTVALAVALRPLMEGERTE